MARRSGRLALLAAASCCWLLLAGVLSGCAAPQAGGEPNPQPVEAPGEPNPPVWPPSVRVFGPESSQHEIESAVNEAFAENGAGDTTRYDWGGPVAKEYIPDHGQFSDSRYAFLFKPGTYTAEVPVGYYTQVLGLGDVPGDVVFSRASTAEDDGYKGVYCQEANYDAAVGSLNTFWRGAENFLNDASKSWFGGFSGMLWAGSQATPLRRVVVTRDLLLFQYRLPDSIAGLASGGFMANSEVRGDVRSGSEQQYLGRNNKHTKWLDGVWNMVFVGSEGAPANHCGADVLPPGVRTVVPPAHPYVTVNATPVVAEKPFISISATGRYVLNIPRVRRNEVGPDLDADGARRVDFDKVYVARADLDDATTINMKLRAGLHVVLSPGIYRLHAPLEIVASGQVLLGLGLATLIPTGPDPAVTVADNIDGVRVAGILLEAGPGPTSALLQWGRGAYPGDPADPGVLSDIFARVGGPTRPYEPRVDTMIIINSGHVIGDNFWLWRADHVEGDALVRGGANPCSVAMKVNGDHVTMYGLAAEHTLQDGVQWNGEAGATYFYQFEFPYDVNQSYGDAGYVGYRVNATVQQHHAWGVGVYHFFRDYPVVVKTAISTPRAVQDSFVSPLAVYLSGNGTVEHVINDDGSATYTKSPPEHHASWWCGGQPGGAPAPAPVTTPPPAPALAPVAKPPATRRAAYSCRVGEAVLCPGAEAAHCAGNQCCAPSGTACPSAEASFAGCPHPKELDCTGPPASKLMLFM